MTISDFIEENREELTTIIQPACLNDVDDEEIEIWIMNDEGLYNWALDLGVEEI